MTLLMDGHSGDVSGRVTYLSAGSAARRVSSASKPERLNDPWTNQMEGQVADLKRRIPILKGLIADCDRMAAESGGPERGGSRQDPRSGAFRLPDLREGDRFETR
jgi:hypothetical protein